MPTPRLSDERANWRYLQFGMFMSLFSEAEAMLRVALREIVGVDKPTALAIFSGTRVDAASKLIRRCYEARRKKIPGALEACLSQLAKINTYRNDLVHYMPDLFAAEEPVVGNVTVSHLPHRARAERFDDETLYGYQRDLAVITLVLSRYPRFGRPQSFSADSKKLLPWLYKSVRPHRKDRGMNRPRPTRKPRPKA